MQRTRSVARPIFSIRLPRQAQIDGLTKWIVLIPAAFSFSSTSRLKSGASMPTNASGLSASRRSRSWLRIAKISRKWPSTSA